MNMQIQGKIHATMEAEQVTQRFRKREFVLELEGESRYPQYVMFQLTGDRCDGLDSFAKGDEVKVETGTFRVTQMKGRRIDYLLSDKTGTLTKNEMKMKKISLQRIQFSEEDLPEMLKRLRRNCERSAGPMADYVKKLAQISKKGQKKKKKTKKKPSIRRRVARKRQRLRLRRRSRSRQRLRRTRRRRRPRLRRRLRRK